MKIRFIALLVLFFFAACKAGSATHFVDINSSNPVSPFSDWSSAANNIQDAIDAAIDGDSVLVTNGVYRSGGRMVYGALTNRVVVNKAITVRSVNGPDFTAIEGFQPNGAAAVRCAYLTNGATLDGFMLTNGATMIFGVNPISSNATHFGSGGGAWCESASAILTNCVIVSNSCTWFGAGAYQGTLNHCLISSNLNSSGSAGGGGVAGCTVLNSIIQGNSAGRGGGALGGSLVDCWLGGNSATLNNGGGVVDGTVARCSFQGNSAILSGGGMYSSSSGSATNCTYANNQAANGGGVYFSTGGNVTSCNFLTNSARTNGGGVYCNSSSPTIRGCIFTGNQAMQGGGGYNGAYSNCTFNGNVATNRGGGAYADSGTGSINCLFTGNLALTNGGGIYGMVWTQCKFSGNRAGFNGGAASFANLNGCTVTDNTAQFGGGVYNCGLSECLVTRNSADTGGGAYCKDYNNVFNSTVVLNYATNTGGGVYLDSSLSGMRSSIVYFNTAPAASDYTSLGTINYCCLTPLAAGTGYITNDPALIDLAGGNFRLQANSPCINTGNGFPGAIDLDGRPRVVGAKIDIGAYEFQGAGVGEFTYWLQQNGLPTDGSADYTDTDADQMNNWQEWIAGTSPTNSESVLKLVSVSTSVAGATLSWRSVGGKNYWIERASDLAVPSSFSVLQSNIAGQAGLTSFTDGEATNSAEYFYRVGVK